MSHIDLNNPDLIYRVDAGQTSQALFNLPDQFLAAVELAEQVDLGTTAGREYRQIVVTGLGGSAIGGDFLRVYAANRIKLPVVVNRDYTLPAFVDQETLVFATSYSGNTEETISAYREAKERGAQVVAVTTGGKLGKLAEDDGFPVIKIPAGIQPRAATGYLFVPTLIVLEKIGLLSGIKQEISDTAAQLKALREEIKPEVPVESNQAKAIASKLSGHIPVIYGASCTSEVVAARWKGQINENSKAMAYYNIFPELNHNELVGFTYPEDLLKQLEVIILRHRDDHPRVSLRMDITKSLIAGRVRGITEVSGRGSSFLAQTFTLTYLGDYVSYYMAILNGEDPTPVKVIEKLKQMLAEERG